MAPSPTVARFPQTGNYESRKKVFEAEQKVEHDKKLNELRIEELKKEQELAETMSLARKGGAAGAGRSVSFLYEPPPGLAEMQQRELEVDFAR